MDARSSRASAGADPVAAARAVERMMRTGLSGYLGAPTEAGLAAAYEAGRAALAGKLSIPAVVSMHGRALRRALAGEPSRATLARGHSLAAQFLAEALAPYEMTHRGYQDALEARRQVNIALEAEVRRIAQALHDEAGQLLVSVHLEVAALGEELGPALQPRVQRLLGLLGEVESQLRGLSHELRPSLLDDLGWLPALRFLADAVTRRCGIRVEVHGDLRERPPPQVETALYRCVQEALSNATRHAGARRVAIEVARAGRELRCTVADDGVGFDAAAAVRGPGLGLRGMRERITAVGGSLLVDAAPGRGARLVFAVPVAP